MNDSLDQTKVFVIKNRIKKINSVLIYNFLFSVFSGFACWNAYENRNYHFVRFVEITAGFLIFVVLFFIYLIIRIKYADAKMEMTSMGLSYSFKNEVKNLNWNEIDKVFSNHGVLKPNSIKLLFFDRNGNKRISFRTNKDDDFELFETSLLMECKKRGVEVVVSKSLSF